MHGQNHIKFADPYICFYPIFTKATVRNPMDQTSSDLPRPYSL